MVAAFREVLWKDWNAAGTYDYDPTYDIYCGY